jgi:hypothetical protein
VTDGAAHDFAKNVAAAFVGGQDAVGDEERGGAGVIGDDAQRGGSAFAFFEFFFALKIYAAEFGGAL